MIKGMQKGSFTIEASIWISFLLFMMMTVLRGGIMLFQESKDREICVCLQEMNTVKQFYNYQILREMGEEITDD